VQRDFAIGSVEVYLLDDGGKRPVREHQQAGGGAG
jgi:hypothetical protein